MMKELGAGILLAVVGVACAVAVAAPLGDAGKGQTQASQICAACHGVDGNSPIPINPNLAGQHPEYLYKQLRNYKSGERENAIMNGIAATLSEDDMRNLAAYFAAQKPRQGSASDAKLASAGQKLYRGGNAKNGLVPCAGCHSPTGAGIPAQYPRLKGQHAQYTVGQLQAFKAGQRANDTGSMMRSIASRLTDADMAAVAEYVAGLK
jgi:cytochrome c553